MKTIEVSKKELAELYAVLPTAEVCKRLGGISSNRLYTLLRAAGIPKRREYKQRKNIKLVD